MIKIYEAIKQNSARLVTTWCNVAVTLNFVDGNVYQGKGAQLVTNDRFVQDAIEHDPRFGVTIKLKKRMAEESDNVEAEKTQNTNKKDAAQNTSDKAQKGKGKKGAAKDIPSGAEAIESVKTMNDAMDYFAEKGELLESAEGLSELCGKYGVAFPNLAI